MRRLVMTFAEALFRVLFTYDCVGEERIPAEGGVVVAANHPSYLDPVLLSLQVARPIRFMAWDALFRVPLLGAVIRAFGAFPVDVRRGQGREAYARARELVAAGEVVGIFPEGKRTDTGEIDRFRPGIGMIASRLEVPVVPVRIEGLEKVLHHTWRMARPGRVRVAFGRPMRLMGSDYEALAKQVEDAVRGL